ncbi:MAG: hypothetical protein U0793_10990 [Gemmataceae bacterium]
MKIEDLQLHLTNLASLFRGAKAKAVADELEEACASLQPYRELRLKDFAGMIGKLEAALAKAQAAKPARAKKDPAALAAALERVADLYNRAAQESVTRDGIVAAFAELEALGPALKDLKALAPRVNVAAKGKAADLLGRVRAAVLERKGMVERVEV